MYRALLQNKYLYCSLSIERQRFSVMRINPDSIVDSRLVIDKITLFRISVFRHSVHVDESRTIRYMLREQDREQGLSLIRKTRQSTRKFLSWGKGKSVQKHGIHSWFLLPWMRIPGILGIQTHGRSRLSRTAKINEFYVRCFEGMRKGKSSHCSDFPIVKVRLMYVFSCKLPWTTFKRMHTSTDFVRGFSCSNYSSLTLIMRKQPSLLIVSPLVRSLLNANVKMNFTLTCLTVYCS